MKALKGTIVGLRVVGLHGPDPEKALLLSLPLRGFGAYQFFLSMCGIAFVAGWHADTPRHCSCAQDDASVELMGRLRDANAVRG